MDLNTPNSIVNIMATSGEVPVDQIKRTALLLQILGDASTRCVERSDNRLFMDLNRRSRFDPPNPDATSTHRTFAPPPVRI